jgi:putative ATP-binding cassette transporter
MQSISSFAAVIARLSVLAEAVQQPPPAGRTAEVVVEDDSRLVYDRLTLSAPDDSQVFLRKLSAEIPRGTRVLVTGPNEVARTALLHATAGIWPSGAGRIVRPTLDDVFFLPQRPYLPPGTLRDVLLRTGQEDSTSDDRIRTALEDAGLDHVLKRAGGLDVEHDWPTIVSLGDQQQLALTRLIFARPAFAMLDRVSAALNPAQVRQWLQRLDENSITYITLAEVADSVDLYDATLEIDADGQWQWKQVNHSADRSAAAPDRRREVKPETASP